MLFFKKKGSKTVDLEWLGTDMHSHLIPGIDDGAEDMATSVAMIKELQNLGYSKLITTPHILWEMYPNTPDKIAVGINEVQQACGNAGINIELKAAAEYYIDEHFETELQAKKPLLPISANTVLVEMSMVNAPMDIMETLFEMQLQNYQPVIAHPERYVYLERNKDFFGRLKDAGYMLQLNLLSLTGFYGTSVKELAEYLVKKEYYDLAGTDAHSLRHIEALKRLAGSAALQRIKEAGLLKNHLL